MGGGILWERFPEWEKWSVKEVSILGKKKTSIQRIKIMNYPRYFKEYEIVKQKNASEPRFKFKNGTTGNYDYRNSPSGDYKYTPVSYWSSEGDYCTDMQATYRSYMLIGTRHDSGDDYAYGTLYKAIENKQKEKDKLIETVQAPEGTYPDNGIKDGFWYIKKK